MRIDLGRFNILMTHQMHYRVAEQKEKIKEGCRYFCEEYLKKKEKGGE